MVWATGLTDARRLLSGFFHSSIDLLPRFPESRSIIEKSILRS